MGAGTDETGNVIQNDNASLEEESLLEGRAPGFVEPPPPAPETAGSPSAARDKSAGVGIYNSPQTPPQPGLSSENSNEDSNIAEAQIVETRSELSKTIGALKEKLNPSNLIKQAKDTMGLTVKGRAEQTINTTRDTIKSVANHAVDSAKGILNRGNNPEERSGDISGAPGTHIVDTAKPAAKGMGSPVIATIRRNPFPIAITLMGLAWLYRSIRNQRSEMNADGLAPPNSTPIPDSPDSVTDRIQDKANDMGNMMHEKVGDAVDSARDTASRVGDTVQDKAHNVKTGVSQLIEERPFLAGSIAMVLGMAAGFIVPETRRENQLMGKTRDRLATQAERAVREKISHSVDEAAKTVAEKVESVTHEMLGTSR